MEFCVCGAATISIVGYVGIAIASMVIFAHLILFAFEAGISSITSTYILCHTLPNSTFTCPQPFYWKNYDEAMSGSRDLATHLWNGMIAVFVCGIVFYLIMACMAGSFSARQNYSRV